MATKEWKGTRERNSRGMRQSEKENQENQTLFENAIMKPNTVCATPKLKLGKLFK